MPLLAGENKTTIVLVDEKRLRTPGLDTSKKKTVRRIFKIIKVLHNCRPHTQRLSQHPIVMYCGPQYLTRVNPQSMSFTVVLTGP
jgi:hypothetical protein